MNTDKTLVIAPHPDDEINLAGQIIVELRAKGKEVFVLYTTNGDFESRYDNKRIKEAIDALQIFGVSEENIFIMGYPNGWNEKKHLYNAKSNYVCNSKLGKTKTNSIVSHPEVAYSMHGVHREFTRTNFKNDIKEIIEMLLPDLIICAEFDKHPDHRATSLFFDEVMGEILKSNKIYRPTVLKKYIHEGVWYGEKDYHSIPMVLTKTKGIRYYCGTEHDLDSPAFMWEDRISLRTLECTRTKYLRDNVLYKAAKKHKVTTAWYEMQRVINADVVYWKRNTDNLLFDAEISSTSGEVEYLRDFKLYDSIDINRDTDALIGTLNSCWKPEVIDNEKIITIRFDNDKLISQMNFYEDCDENNHIKRLIVNVKNDKYVIELNNNGTKTKLVFDDNYYAKEIIICVEEWIGSPAIAEIEVLSEKENNNDIYEHFEKYSEENKMKETTLGQKLEKFFLKIMFLFKFKIKYELKRRLGRCK